MRKFKSVRMFMLYADFDTYIPSGTEGVWYEDCQVWRFAHSSPKFGCSVLEVKESRIESDKRGYFTTTPMPKERLVFRVSCNDGNPNLVGGEQLAGMIQEALERSYVIDQNIRKPFKVSYTGKETEC